MNIVVVEDEQKTRAGIIRLIGIINEDYKVVGEADNGLNGMDIIKGTKPDLVIVDINMPKMNGIVMLESLKEQGIQHKTIILSGYSEFEYARKALRMGVDEYLLKPITADELKRILDNINRDIKHHKLFGFEQGEPSMQSDQMLQHFVMNGDTDVQALSSYLLEVFQFTAHTQFQDISSYLGKHFEQYKVLIKEQLSLIFDRAAANGKSIIFDLSATHEIVILIQFNQPPLNLDYFLQNEVLNPLRYNPLEDMVMCWTSLQSLSELKSNLEDMHGERKWSIVLGVDKPIDCNKNRHLSIKHFAYPTELENKAKQAAASAKPGEAMIYFEGFLAFCAKERYHPKHIIEGCTRFSSSVLHVISEVHGAVFSIVDQKEQLQKVMNAQTDNELKSAFLTIGQFITSYDIQKESMYSLIVYKSIRMINEHYQECITLDEIASLMHITPEYLSTLFNKEVGKPYTAFLREVRMKKAKELLIGTNLRAFEISEKVGYPDSKYFSRVFKEFTGLSPGEYQKINK